MSRLASGDWESVRDRVDKRRWYALAFAVGAAVGATLPHTAQEDQLLGEQADKLRGKAMKTAGLEPQMVMGRRYTDDRTLAIACTPVGRWV